MMVAISKEELEQRARDLHQTVEEVLVIHKYLKEIHGYDDDKATAIMPVIAIVIHLERLTEQIRKLEPELVITEMYKPETTN